MSSDDHGLPPISPDLVGKLEALAEALSAREDHADLARQFEWLIDALILRGQLPATYRRLVAKIRGDRSSVRLATFVDKYAVTGPDIDCAARIPLCAPDVARSRSRCRRRTSRSGSCRSASASRMRCPGWKWPVRVHGWRRRLHGVRAEARRVPRV